MQTTYYERPQWGLDRWPFCKKYNEPKIWGFHGGDYEKMASSWMLRRGAVTIATRPNNQEEAHLQDNKQSGTCKNANRI
jgi:hypothetical protein